MATAYHNLSDYDFNSVPNAEEMKFGIVVSEWNANITGALLDGAVKTLKKHGAKEENILVKTVPGASKICNLSTPYGNICGSIFPVMPAPAATASSCTPSVLANLRPLVNNSWLTSATVVPSSSQYTNTLFIFIRLYG